MGGACMTAPRKRSRGDDRQRRKKKGSSSSSSSSSSDGRAKKTRRADTKGTARPRRSISREVRRVSVTPSPSPEPPPKTTNRPIERKKLSESPVRRSPERAAKGSGKGEEGSWQREIDEAWLRDRTAMRQKAFFSMLTMYPRSPSPQRVAAQEDKA